MRRLTAIVAVNEQGAIGRDNRLPWRLRSDLRFFRQQTEGNIVIMGSNTWRSLGKPLPNRTNIVVTHHAAIVADQPESRAAPSLEAALALAETMRSGDQEVFVIGGASIYEQAAPYVDRYLITEVRQPVADADRFLSPALFGDVADWTIARIASGSANDQGDDADFVIYECFYRDPAAIGRRRDRAISAVP